MLNTGTWWRAIARDQRGSMLPIAAAAGGALLVIASLAVDVSAAYVEQNRLQSAVDSAALAAADDLPDVSAARATASRIVARLLPRNSYGNVLGGSDVTVGSWDSARRSMVSDVYSPSAVKVTASRSQARGNPLHLHFAGILGISSIDLSAQAIAVRGSRFCINALATSGRGIALAGNSQISAPECGIQVDSSSRNAITANGASSIIASDVCVAGGTSGAVSISPAPLTGCPAKGDPLASLAPPGVGGCTYSNTSVSGGSRTFSPGVYCGGISLGSGAIATFRPGIYVIKDGPLAASGGSTLSGDGVGFYLVGSGALIDFGGSSGVRFTAPTSGSMAGIIFFQSRQAPTGVTNKITGSGSIWYEGTLYFPKQSVEWYGGNSISRAPWTLFVAQSFTLNGGSTLGTRADYRNSPVPLPSPLSRNFRAQLVQ